MQLPLKTTLLLLPLLLPLASTSPLPNPDLTALSPRNPNPVPDSFGPIPELGGQIGDYSDALGSDSDSDDDLPGSDDDLDEWAENFIPGGGR